MRWRQIIEKFWGWFGEDRRVFEILGVLVVLQVLTLIIPQAPVAPARTLAFSRWLAEMRTTLGSWVSPLSALGLLSIRTSLWLRLALVYLLLVTVVRGMGLVEVWERRLPSRRWFNSLILLGSGLLLLGWGLQIRIGWIEPRVIIWPDQPVHLSHHRVTLPPPKGAAQLWAGRYGLFWLPRGTVIGLEVQAKNAAGDILPLVTQSAPEDKLFIALTATQPEAFFALPPLGYAFRASLSGEQVQIQAYQLATGAFLDEMTVQEEISFVMADAILQVDRRVLPQLEAVYNPGAPLTLLGIGLLLFGGIGQRVFQTGRAPDKTSVLQTNNEQGD